jgi:thiamine biosynthesis lipoprotein
MNAKNPDNPTPDPQVNRRGFLSLKGLNASTGGVVGALVPELPKRKVDPPDQQSNLAVARMAMACEFSLLLPYDCPDPFNAANAALDEIQRQDDRLTVYRNTSLISHINAEAAKTPVPVDDELFELLVRCRALTDATDGAFDIATGALIKAWGFFKGPNRVPTDRQIQNALAQTGMRHVALEPAGRSVRFARTGVEFNLGSIGKGYAIDRAAQIARSHPGLDAVLIQGGKSSMFGVGAPKTDPRGWPVSIGSPTTPGESVAIVRLKDTALSTSGDANQFFIHNGQRYGHVLDPRTGRPADRLASASVIAPDAATADALATAFNILGIDFARNYCQNHPEIATLLVPWPGGPEPRQPVAINMKPDQWDPVRPTPNAVPHRSSDLNREKPHV